jgi:hypothetical protein
MTKQIKHKIQTKIVVKEKKVKMSSKLYPGCKPLKEWKRTPR